MLELKDGFLNDVLDVLIILRINRALLLVLKNGFLNNVLKILRKDTARLTFGKIWYVKQ